MFERWTSELVALVIWTRAMAFRGHGSNARYSSRTLGKCRNERGANEGGYVVL